MRVEVRITREVRDTIERNVEIAIEADELLDTSLSELVEQAVDDGDYTVLDEDTHCGDGDAWEVDAHNIREL